MSSDAYHNLYLIIVAFFTFVFCQRYYILLANETQNTEIVRRSRVGVILAIFMAVFIGTRPEYGSFGDSYNYAESYENYLWGNTFKFDFFASNLIFDNLFAVFASLKIDVNYFFVFISLIYFLCSFFAIKKLFPFDDSIVYLVFLGAFSTFSYGTNGLKAGMAASIFLLALAYRDKLKVCIPLLLISWGFHHSMQLPLAAFALTLIYKNSKTYFLLWFVCFLLACFHVTWFQEWFGGVTDEKGAGYLLVENEESDDSIKGFRFDFILYSAMPIVVGWYAVYRKGLQLSKFYTCLLNLYLTTNAIWLLCMYASFTNRIAYLSWQLYPVVLIYPFLNEDWGEKKYKILSTVAGLHLAFTLFMTWVYYAD